MITMNAWVTEKALRIAQAAAYLMPPVLKAPEETEKEVIESHLSYIYIMACTLLAYAGGAFPETLTADALKAFGGGREAMLQFASALEGLLPRPGWNLPNPVYHSLVVPIAGEEVG